MALLVISERWWTNVELRWRLTIDQCLGRLVCPPRNSKSTLQYLCAREEYHKKRTLNFAIRYRYSN